MLSGEYILRVKSELQYAERRRGKENIIVLEFLRRNLRATELRFPSTELSLFSSGDAVASKHV